MPVKNFLEKYPLYRKLEIDIQPVQRSSYGVRGTTLEKLPKPAINMPCDICQSIQTFNMENNYWDDDDLPYASSGPLGVTFRLKYRCAGCKEKLILFYVEFGGTAQKTKRGEENVICWIRKVGQNPSWDINIDKKLESILGEFADLYKNGLVCESQSYGIGAYAYYRRIVENIIDSLLDSVVELIEREQEKEKFLKALEKTKSAKNAEDKIRLVKDLLPASLLPEGLNPLNVIYTALSEGLHDKSDEECLELAEEIKKSLLFLVNLILAQKEAKKEFTESMKKLLEKKNHGQDERRSISRKTSD